MVFARDRALQVLGAQLEAVVLRAGHGDRLALGQQDHVRIGDPEGRRDDHLVARVQGRHQGVVEHLLAAGADGDLLGLVVQAVVALELLDDRRLQLGRAVDRRVLGLAALDGGDGRLLDVVRGVEIRLAGAQADDVAAGGLELAGLLGHRDGRRGLDP